MIGLKKVNGEEFQLKKENNQEYNISDKKINEKYEKGEFRIVTEQARYPIKSIPDMFMDGVLTGDYKLNPEYQRRKRWSDEKKSRLIESFIINVPLPPIFLYEYEYSQYEVMDGLQRLTTIIDFYKGDFSLKGLEYWRELNGQTYSELPHAIRRGIDRRYISSVILLNETAKDEEEAEELKQIVFERLNSGGEKLEPQETRNALYNGKFNKLCIRLSTNDKFRKMWRIPNENELKKDNHGYSQAEIDRYKEMEDVELVLRFFAYRFLNEYTSNSMRNFLDVYLIEANKWSDNTLVELEDIFENSIELVYEIFGKEAFLLPKSKGKQSKKITKTIYEPLMQSISKYLDYKESLLKNKKEIRENKFSNQEDLTLENGKKLFDGKYNHRSVIEKRIEYFDKLFELYIK